MAAAYERSPSPLNAVILFPFGGAVGRGPADATAFFYRSARYSMTLLGGWEDPKDDAANMTWLRETWDEVQPHLAEGVYVNELFDDEGAERVRSAYGPAFARLQALKREYDPTNLFHLNQNIQP
jgi:FAD/FMN-containing dehydrogenase